MIGYELGDSCDLHLIANEGEHLFIFFVIFISFVICHFISFVYIHVFPNDLGEKKSTLHLNILANT